MVEGEKKQALRYTAPVSFEFFLYFYVIWAETDKL